MLVDLEAILFGERAPGDGRAVNRPLFIQALGDVHVDTRLLGAVCRAHALYEVPGLVCPQWLGGGHPHRLAPQP